MGARLPFRPDLIGIRGIDNTEAWLYITGRHHYMGKLGILLLTAVLLAGLVSCIEPVPLPPLQYTLAVYSTPGGLVTNPGEGISTYDEGSVVGLAAIPGEGYLFVEWTGDVETIANAGASVTSITMNADYLITAVFEEVPPPPPPPAPRYNLTVSTTAGGSVVSHGQGTFTYDEGEEVELLARPDSGFYFFRWTGDVDTVSDIESTTTTIIMDADYSITASFVAQVSPMVAAGAAHTLGLRADSRVVAVGRNTYGQCNVGDWIGIGQVAAGGDHTLGLKSDGTVVAVGRNDHGQCNVGDWTNIVQVAGGGMHTIGLKSSGTVVAVGQNEQEQCNVGGWTDIVQVAAGWSHTLGLRSDGTVLAAGRNTYGECDVEGWADIIQVGAGAYHSLGIRANGTVVAVGWDISRQTSGVGGWIDVVQVAGGYEHSVGLRSDGNLVRCVGWQSPGQCDVSDWKDIVQIAAGAIHTVGLRSDGTVLAVGRQSEGQCDVGDWMLN